MCWNKFWRSILSSPKEDPSLKVSFFSSCQPLKYQFKFQICTAFLSVDIEIWVHFYRLAWWGKNILLNLALYDCRFSLSISSILWLYKGASIKDVGKIRIFLEVLPTNIKYALMVEGVSKSQKLLMTSFMNDPSEF